MTDKERIVTLETKMDNVDECLHSINEKLDKLLDIRSKGSNKAMIILTVMNAALMVATIGVVAVLVFG